MLLIVLMKILPSNYFFFHKNRYNRLILNDTFDGGSFMRLIYLMSKQETAEAIELLKHKIELSVKLYGLYDTRTKELDKQLNLYVEHYHNLTD